MYEELKAQMQVNQQIIQENNTSFKERVEPIKNKRIFINMSLKNFFYSLKKLKKKQLAKIRK